MSITDIKIDDLALHFTDLESKPEENIELHFGPTKA